MKIAYYMLHFSKKKERLEGWQDMKELSAKRVKLGV